MRRDESARVLLSARLLPHSVCRLVRAYVAARRRLAPLRRLRPRPSSRAFLPGQMIDPEREVHPSYEPFFGIHRLPNKAARTKTRLGQAASRSYLMQHHAVLAAKPEVAISQPLDFPLIQSGKLPMRMARCYTGGALRSRPFHLLAMQEIVQVHCRLSRRSQFKDRNGGD